MYQSPHVFNNIIVSTFPQHCAQTRRLLHNLQSTDNDAWSLDILDLDLMDEGDGPLVQMELLTFTAQRTVPNIFIGGKHVGGNSDLQQLYQSGRLEQLLDDLKNGRVIADI